MKLNCPRGVGEDFNLESKVVKDWILGGERVSIVV